MLPSELLFQVCDYLQPPDIISLSEIDRFTKTTLLPLRKLCLKIPYYCLEYSQWNSWQECILDFESEASHNPFEHVSLPKHENKPLPEDFRALKGGVDRRLHYEWNLCDLGFVCEHGILNLKEKVDTSADFDLYMDEYKPYPVRTFQVNKQGAYADLVIRAMMQTQSCQAVIAVTSDVRYVSSPVSRRETTNTMNRLFIQYNDGTTQEHVLKSIDGITHSDWDFHVLVADNAVIFTRRYGAVFSTFYVLKGGEPVFIADSLPIENVNGTCSLFYNGRVFLTYMDQEPKIQVIPLESEPLNPAPVFRNVYLYQDERYPRYGLAYQFGTFLAYVVDLEKREVHCVMEGDPAVIGLSNGQLGMWTYTEEYLMDKCEEQELSTMKELMREICDRFQ